MPPVRSGSCLGNLTRAISCGPDRRDACGGKRRDGTDRQLDWHVRRQ
jgi:hypothetical protein